MKKLIISIFLLATIACSKGDALNPASANSCEKSAQEYEKVVSSWVQDPSNKANCEALKKSLNNIIKNC